ncbi:MAG: gliding motility-associated ABC transporter ATP-binding subunit GldA [Prevotellaceae bacterium]|jgi:ABC-2 type transport system ATP-binding protein|nr:gliding motility-associated ABC transporter ATP-binding subunit GldA [Prevotellaceae bacterium]
MSVQIQNITKTYGGKRALNRISFGLGSGEIVGFLGPNGAGKSTLMKIITGYIDADSGSVEVCGEHVTERNLATKRLIGYLPEHNPLYPDMYVREYLGFAADFHALKNKRARIEQMIERTGLAAESHKRIRQLSKGYRQRVGLAQALLHDPAVLILDEPTTGLDPNQLLEIRRLIAEIGREKTVLFSTHIMQEVEAICQRVVVINQGNIVADAAEAALITAQNSLLHIEVEFDRLPARPIETAAATITSVLELAPKRYRIAAATDVRQALFQFATEENIAILTLKTIEHDMETIFRELTTTTE